jgi:hypothetical protein
LLYACIVGIGRKPSELIFNRVLRFFVATNESAAIKLLQVCEQVKITWSQVETSGLQRGWEKKVPAKAKK